MSLLERPEAQALLQKTSIDMPTVRGCGQHLTDFLDRYLPLFGRAEPQQHARLAIEGRLGGLQRKTTEPIAREANVPRRALQRFVGAGEWDDDDVLAELRRQVGEKLGDPNGVLIIDPSSFPKKGNDSCGVQRQWCGRLGKTDNCQVGVFLAYAAAKGHALVDRRLYLPKCWAEDRDLRKKCHVPARAKQQTSWEIALDLLERNRDVPHAWVTADDEFGRPVEFRRALRQRGEAYVLDVPCNTLVRDLDEPVRRRGRRGPRKPPFRRADAWAKRQPENRWQEFEIRGGTKGPLRAKVLRARVQTWASRRAEEVLLVIQTLEETPRTYYVLAWSPAATATDVLVRAHAERHRVEETLQEGKGEVGLGHYEVRSWIGWHHHMTLCCLALLFVVLEKLRVGEKNTDRDGFPGASDPHRTPPSPPTDLRRDRPKGKRRSAA
jgi:SRSO17 transposase